MLVSLYGAVDPEVYFLAFKVTREEILEELERIVGSKDFAASKRTRMFFEHLVKSEIDGKGEELHGTALAMDVFGRGVDFDPNTDPVVRTEAVKLRKALSYYYLTSGGEDRVEISVPKGRYRPTFRFRELETTNATLTDLQLLRLPTLGIRSFSGSDTERAIFFRNGLPEEIALELARFGHIRVLTGFRAENSKVGGQEDCKSLESCDYILGGTVREDGECLRVIVQLKRRATGALLWSERKDIYLSHANVFKTQEDIAKHCAIYIADAYGFVATDIERNVQTRPASDSNVYQALLAFHSHLRTNRVSSLSQMMELCKLAVANNPTSGLAHALLAFGHVEEVSVGQQRLKSVIEDGRTHAEKALALEPQCQEALVAAAIYAQLDGDEPRFLQLVDAGIRANTNGNLLLAVAGGWIALAGDPKKGIELVRKATDANPVLPTWTKITLCLKDVESGDYKAASEKLRQLDVRHSVSDRLIVSAVHSLAGETERARAQLPQLNGDFTIEEYLNDLPYAPRVIEMIRTGLKLL
jgi:TolB-like protein